MIVVLNNKSNLTKEEFIQYEIELGKLDLLNHKVVLCAGYLNLPLFKTTSISLGAQTVSAYPEGAYTGEVNANQLKSMNASYVLVGHSERREYNKETNEDNNKKINQLLTHSITPILCIGETKEERENNTYKEVIKTQLKESFANIKSIENIIIAYEPVWSIGTGIIPTNEQIEEVFIFLRELLPNNTLIYGGSANEENIEILKEISLIEGYLLGGLSLKPQNLQEFLKKI